MQANASDFRWSMDASGDWLCIRTKGARKMLDELTPGKLYDVEIKQHRKRRSLDANAYFWSLADKLATKTGIPKTDVYRLYIRDIGGNSETLCVAENAAGRLRAGWEHNGLGWQTDTFPSKKPGYINVILYYGSSTYDSAQMSRLIDMIVYDCKSQGIETMPPDKLAALMEGWECGR